MKITGVTAFLAHPGVGKNLCFVKIDTDEGIHGWGECYTQSDRDLQVMAHVDQLERYLVGRDPFNIKHFTYLITECSILKHQMTQILLKVFSKFLESLLF